MDVVRCTLCKDAVAPMYCEVCHIDLCKDCVVEHLSDTDGFHKVVSLKQFLLTLRYNSVCPNHPTKQCEQHCEECNVRVCGICVSSKEHDQHKKEDILKILTTKKALIQKDLLELKNSVYSKYQEAAENIPIQRADVRKHSEQEIAALNEQREALHKEIDTIVQRMMTEINEMDKQYTPAIEKQEHVINKTMNEIKQVILDLKSLLETSDVGLVCKYKSKIEEFRKLPPKLKIFLPNFLPQKINREQLLKQFGSLSIFSIKTEEQGYTMPSPEAESSPSARPLLDVPRLITDIPTYYLYNVSCLSDEEIWTSGDNKIMKLYNLKGELLKSVKTKSGYQPEGISVTRSGGLVYADSEDCSINLVSGTQIQTLIKLRDWKPRGLCSTFSGDLLVIMDHDVEYLSSDYDDDDDDYADDATKVVRYSGSTETQTIKRDDQGERLYSIGYGIKFLCENRNMDICVADHSQGNILTSDNDRIHIIGQDGHFLRFIHNCGVQDSSGLCVDSRDNLFVAELRTGKVKKLQYYKSTD
ncbi:uncharacterized protein LOC111115455 [Crassostrea virginica]